MARKTQQVKRRGVENKFYIYFATFVMFGSLFLFLAIFGVDFGFVKFGSAVSSGVALGVLAIALIAEYVMDIRYCRAVRRFSELKNSFVDCIPFLNSVALYRNWMKVITGIFSGTLIFSLLALFTPVSRLLPMTLILRVSQFFMYAVIVCFIGMNVVRGIDQLSTKKSVMDDYMKLTDDNSGGVYKTTSMLTSLFYFIPIIRMSVLISDVQFLLTVKDMNDENESLE